MGTSSEFDVVYADVTLNHVCKLLRMLNFRCEIISSLTSHSLKERGIIITRSKEIYKKAQEYNLKSIYLTTTNKYEILKLLIEKFNIKIDVDLKNPRKFCSLCGGTLKVIKNPSKDIQQKYKIPPKASQYHTTFFICEKCKKSYWYGKHLENMLRELKKNEIIG